jgi:hypothetical protein
MCLNFEYTIKVNFMLKFNFEYIIKAKFIVE